MEMRDSVTGIKTRPEKALLPLGKRHSIINKDMSEFLDFYGLETLFEAMDPLEDIQPPKELVDMIKTEVYPFYVAAFSKAAQQEKAIFVDDKQDSYGEEDQIKIIKGFNQIIDFTHEKSKDAPKIKTIILTVPEDMWEPWILEKANKRHDEKPIWKKILQKPIEIFVQTFFKGGKPNKIVLDLEISPEDNEFKALGTLTVPLVDIKTGGKITLYLGLIAREEMFKKYERVAKLGQEMVSIVWEEQVLDTIEHELSHYVQQILGEINKDTEYGEEFTKSTPSEFYPNINSLVNQLRKEVRMETINDIKVDFILDFMKDSSFFSELKQRAGNSGSNEAVEDVNSLIDLAKREFVKRIYKDAILYKLLPPQTELEKVIY
jgi:hypothetical protein